MNINERWVKVGKFPIDEEIPVDGSFQIKVVGSDTVYHFTCTKVEHKTNNDGTIDTVAVLKWNQ